MSDRAYSTKNGRSGVVEQQRDFNVNIFILHKTPAIAATYHCNAHVNKMRTESCQMLSTALRVLIEVQGKSDDPKYADCLVDAMKLSFPAHPCTRWVMDHSLNYVWLYKLAVALVAEHERRFGTTRDNQMAHHRLVGSLDLVPDLFPDNRGVGVTRASQTRLRSWGTAPALAMPVSVQNPDDPVESYRNYYRQHKAHLHNWSPMSAPSWL